MDSRLSCRDWVRRKRRWAIIRIKIGKEIGSTALVADGHHARADCLTSLAVLFGAIGVWLGYPLADPIVGLVISVAILRIVFGTSKSVFPRLLYGIEPEVPDEVRVLAADTDGTQGISEVRVRWLGHKMLAEVNIAVEPSLSVETGHEIAEEVHHRLLHQLKYLSNATVHVDPVGLAGEEHHRHGPGNRSTRKNTPRKRMPRPTNTKMRLATDSAIPTVDSKRRY